MLSRRVPQLNLVIVLVVALIAVVLLTRTALSARGIGDDIDGAITPQLSAVDSDLGRLPVLDRTGMLAEEIATKMLPIAESLGSAADSVNATARDTEAVRDATRPIREQVARIDASVAAIRTALAQLGPVVVQILADTGDVRGNLGRTDTVTDGAAAAMVKVLAELRGIVVDARTARTLVTEIEASLRRTERHGANVAAARILNCPADSQACVPR